ncbi:MAG TPA: helix-turn-helix domain-containing protein [Arthrobacter sp.]|nr:helix-turn-helix domain-containing protein [Arthrobacter sp.]
MGRIRAATAQEWTEACSQAFVPLGVRSVSPGFTANLDQMALTHSVSVTRVVSDSSEVYRSESIIAAQRRDDILLSLQHAGQGTVVQHGREATLGRGQAALYDASAPYRLLFPSRMSELVLQVPRDVVSRTGYAFEDLTARVLPRSAALTALSGLLHALAPANAGPSTGSGHLAEATVNLLRAVLSDAENLPSAVVEPALLYLAICSYIDEHLADPGLGVAQIAAEHHVSERLVHKLFAEQGGSPAAHIRRLRLEHAHKLLAAGHSVTGVTYRVGFSNPDTFTRAYKRRYGYLPSEA